MNNMNPEHEPYIQILIANIAKAKLGPLESKAVMVKFLREASETNPAQALVKACQGWNDGEVLVASLIEQALQKMSTEHPYVKLSPRERIQRDIEKIKQNRNALDWELVLSDQDRKNLTANQLESVEKAIQSRKNPKPIEIPSCFAATASYHGAKIPMALEVKR
jgi:hypothetical protein